MNEPQVDQFTPKQVRSLLIVLPFVTVIGFGLTVWGAYLVQFHVELLKRGETAMGVVVELERGSTSSSSGRSALFPVVKFKTRSGQSTIFRHRTGSNPPAFAKGDEVPVIYDPRMAERALIAEGFRNWLLPGLLLIIGLGVTVLSLRGFVRTRRRFHGMTSAYAS